MNTNTYRMRSLESASPVELVVALYDGMLRFVGSAAEATRQANTRERRIAVKRALDIIMHLQSRLRMDIGGAPARALSDFYAAMFTQLLLASHNASLERFEYVSGCIKNVRDAWQQVARDPEAQLAIQQRDMPAGVVEAAAQPASSEGRASWSA